MNMAGSLAWKGISMIGLALLICAGAFSIGSQTVAHSASTTIQVTSTDGGTGGPECRLRDAITAANTGGVVGGCDGSAGGPTIIELADTNPGAVYELAVIDNNENGLPLITSEITINGHDGTILRSNQDGTPNFRIFEVASNGTLYLNELTVRDGGIVTEGGNLKNSGTTTIQNVTLRFGHAEGGAGISNEGNLTISHSRFINNYGGCGGAIVNDATGALTITHSTVLGNVADT